MKSIAKKKLKCLIAGVQATASKHVRSLWFGRLIGWIKPAVSKDLNAGEEELEPIDVQASKTDQQVKKLLAEDNSNGKETLQRIRPYHGQWCCKSLFGDLPFT